MAKFRIPTDKQLHDWHVKKYVKEEYKFAKEILKLKAERNYETLGLGWCRAAGLYGFNLMDEIIDAYVDGHYAACIALCRSRTELVVRELIYFRWFLENKKKEIQDYLDKRLYRDRNDSDLQEVIKYENLLNRLVFEHFENSRLKLNSELLAIKWRMKNNRKMKVSKLSLGQLQDYCEEKNYLDNEMLSELDEMIELGNFFVHSHYLKPPIDPHGIGLGPRTHKDPKEYSLKLIRTAGVFMNDIFGDYPYKVHLPRENLFNADILKKT